MVKANSFRPSETWMPRWTRPSLVPTIVWRLFIATPLIEPVLIHTPVKCYLYVRSFHPRSCTSANFRPLLTLMCLWYILCDIWQSRTYVHIRNWNGRHISCVYRKDLIRVWLVYVITFICFRRLQLIDHILSLTAVSLTANRTEYIIGWWIQCAKQKAQLNKNPF